LPRLDGRGALVLAGALRRVSAVGVLTSEPGIRKFFSLFDNSDTTAPSIKPRQC